MNFFKTSFWASLSTGITMLSGLVTTKYVAVMIGPEGMAYVGQFNNTTLLISLFATAACTTGIVKYVSEYKDPKQRQAVFANALILVGACVLLTSLVVIVSSGVLSKSIFDNGTYKDVFVIYGLLIIFPTFNLLANAVLNGLQQIRLLSLMNVFAALLNLCAIIIGARYFGIKGVLLANLLSSFVFFFLYLYFLKRIDSWPSKPLSSLYDISYIKLLLGFSAMSVVSGIVAPSLQLFVRTKLLQDYNAHTAGLWQANTRLSDYYLNFVYTVLGIYYLPRLSSLKEKDEIKKEIRLGFMRILPPVILITVGIWIFREHIIRIFLTGSFIDMLVLLKWQLIGDIVKISSWILGYLMVAKAMKSYFIGTEIIFSISFVFFNFFFINHYGMVGTVYAFALNYFLYLVTLIVLLRKYII